MHLLPIPITTSTTAIGLPIHLLLVVLTSILIIHSLLDTTDEEDERNKCERIFAVAICPYAVAV